MTKITKLGKVDKVFSYGKSGFISTVFGENYYFSRESFPNEPRRLNVGELVMFTPSEKEGKPFAASIDAESIRAVQYVMNSDKY